MEAVEFVTAIWKAVIENEHNIYENLFNSIGDVKDPIWREILLIYSGLTKEKRDFLRFLRLIQVNTLSHILGIIDRSIYLNEQRESFLLTTVSERDPMNGTLQDIFLEMEN